MADADASSRILEHMNSDHGHDLSLYLQHYCSVPASSINNPKLISMTVDRMIVTSSPSSSSPPKEYTIPFTPPLSSLSQTRERLVLMTETAESTTSPTQNPNKLKIPYAFPRGTDLIPFLGVGSYFFCAAFLPYLASPGSLPCSLLEEYSPGGVDAFSWLVKTLFWPVLLIHIVEAWWFDRSRCVPFGVKRGSLAWWLWEWTCFMEGFTCFKRFDGLVEVQKMKRKEKGH
ncbi:hypothetical protein MKZ38_008029 [Zalerion maritima]|uniref:DUF2470 domain-containing protein n=1 Tax=Zalerion maritima TaxID=339359 RepID=A0AAD5RHY2_9PEZI|nr:hypothetical protein MKZ38_008029 [Zalerion maritima]